MYDLSFGICFYGDPSIIRLLDSLPKQNKKIVIDGKFKFNPNKEELSDETLRESILKYDNVVLIDAPNLMECDKRQLYCTDNDSEYLFIIDSDEYIIAADWARFFEYIHTLESGIHDIFFEVDNNGGVSSYPRLWVNPKEWKYVKTHNIFKNDNLGIFKSGNTGGTQCPGVLCGMGDELRSELYLKDTFDYQVKMIEYELPFRHKFRDGDMTPFE